MKCDGKLAIFIVLLTLLFAFAAACGDDDDDDDNNDNDDNDDNNDDFPDDDDVLPDDDEDDDALPFCEIDETRIDEIVAGMSLREKVGQMYYVGVNIFPWFESSEAIEKIQQLHVGAVHANLFLTIGLWNAWTVQNTNRLQELALAEDPPIPLIIGIDQEGGAPQSMSAPMGGTDTPGNMGLGATFDPDITDASYALMADQLRTVGINVNLAPVLEVMTSHEETSMYTRCFGEDTGQVTAHAAAAVHGSQRRLVAATAKHFPGQTAAPGDEHTELPVANQDEATLRAVYLPPYQAAVEAGIDLIMPTHAQFTAWDPERPATLSYPILTELLREELGFEGVIITDDMNMWGVAGRDWGELPDVLAIRAGADMIMDIFENFEPTKSNDHAGSYPTDLAGQIDYVIEAVNDGRLSEERIDQSVRRILRLKIKYCLFDEPFRPVAGIDQRVDTPAQRKESARWHEQAVTLVRNDAGIWPLSIDDPPRVHVVAPGWIVMEMYPGASWPNYATRMLVGAMQDIDPRTTGAIFSSPPYGFVVDRLVAGAAAADPDVLVIGTYNALTDANQTDLVKRLLALDKPTIVLSLAMPYDLLAFPEATTYLAAYSNRDLAVEAVARVLYGLAEPGGRLPVSLPGLYPVGWSALEP